MILHHKLEDVRRLISRNATRVPDDFYNDCITEKLIDDILEAIFGCGHRKIEEALRGAEPPVRRDAGQYPQSGLRSRRSSG